MTKSKSHAAKAHSCKPTPAKGPIRHIPGKGLMVSTQPGPFPHLAHEKVICAKSIIQAVVAAHDSHELNGENYDIHWPLSFSVELLEQAAQQLDEADLKAFARRHRKLMTEAAGATKGGAS